MSEGPVVTESQHFTVSVFQDRHASLDDDLLLLLDSDVVPIVFKFKHIFKHRLILNEDDPSDSVLLNAEIVRQLRHLELITDLGLSSLEQQSSQLRDRFIDILSNKFHVPEEWHQSTVDKIFTLVENVAVHPITVFVTNETVRLRFLQTPSLEEVGIGSLEVKKRREICSICLDEFVVAPIVCLSSCLHVFHRDCILRWLVKKRECPLCRCPMQKKKRKLDEMTPSSTPTGLSSNISRITS